MAITNSVPWAGLNKNISRESGKAEDIIKTANLNWTVSKRPMFIQGGLDSNGEIVSDIKVSDQVAVVRDDTNTVLGCVGESYAPIQNTEMFAFFNSLVGVGNLNYDSAGSFYNGKRVFATAKTKGQIRIVGTDDISDSYIVVCNSHDGSLALKALFTNIRIACSNSLNAAIKGSKNSISLRHSGNISSRIAEAQQVLGLNVQYTNTFNEIANTLAKQLVDSKMVEQFLKDCFKPATKEINDEESTRVKNIQLQVKNLFENDPKNNMSGISGSKWALYNAVTQYADHEAVSVKKNADNRMNSIMFGSSANLKQKAFDLITTI